MATGILGPGDGIGGGGVLVIKCWKDGRGRMFLAETGVLGEERGLLKAAGGFPGEKGTRGEWEGKAEET